MICQKKIIIGFGILLSALCSVFWSSASYAIDDISITIDSSFSASRGDSVFPNCDSTCFSQYSYFKVEVLSSVLYGSSDIRFTFVTPGYSNKTIYLPSFTSSYVALSSDISNILWYTTGISSEFSYRLSLSNTLPGTACPEPPSDTLTITQNGDYDVSDYSDVTVNVPQVSETPYDDKLDKLINSVYVVAGTMLVIYFFYAIYRMFFKGVK